MKIVKIGLLVGAMTITGAFAAANESSAMGVLDAAKALYSKSGGEEFARQANGFSGAGTEEKGEGADKAQEGLRSEHVSLKCFSPEGKVLVDPANPGNVGNDESGSDFFKRVKGLSDNSVDGKISFSDKKAVKLDDQDNAKDKGAHNDAAAYERPDDSGKREVFIRRMDDNGDVVICAASYSQELVKLEKKKPCKKKKKKAKKVKAEGDAAPKAEEKKADDKKADAKKDEGKKDDAVKPASAQVEGSTTGSAGGTGGQQGAAA